MALRIGRSLLPRLLKQRKLTQVELSLRTKIDVSTISLYANNKRIMSLDNAKIIADVLEVYIDDLYEWQKD